MLGKEPQNGKVEWGGWGKELPVLAVSSLLRSEESPLSLPTFAIGSTYFVLSVAATT